MLHIYYGFGRGKTSTLNGTVLRAISANKKIEYFRFLKGRKTGEDEQLAKLGVVVRNFHYTDKFTIEMTDEEKRKEREIVLKGLNAISSSKAEVIFIDEGLDLVKTKHATEDEIILAIQTPYRNNADILISGHYKLDSIFEVADLITEFIPEKHYFDKGVKAKKGIEF
ncbi:cob(I)yrinic acid a,c-diamide adenosyltransferase [Mycoplasma marinum]|uniref:Cob(I)yrinic acid a,c-diamide adenosyltransferase n=1 Tax=Mycoplasma marinum TaxID=1937190 RepID=A0A4R0XK56_9MOLU|nr:cob(I)yrinic acid a,c-diamide adenosyltransferase [Mycoplasma marinum]TCG10834.1 hypothetical protein C4B24_03840 [Mycoplasma marinum]